MAMQEIKRVGDWRISLDTEKGSFRAEKLGPYDRVKDSFTRAALPALEREIAKRAGVSLKLMAADRFVEMRGHRADFVLPDDHYPQRLEPWMIDVVGMEGSRPRRADGTLGQLPAVVLYDAAIVEKANEFSRKAGDVLEALRKEYDVWVQSLNLRPLIAADVERMLSEARAAAASTKAPEDA